MVRGTARFAWRELASALLTAAAALAFAAPSAEALQCELEAQPARAVVRVIDAETLMLDDGAEVRLVGALAPRAMDGGADEAAWPLEQAAKAELDRLALGRSVELGVAGRRTDRYGRLLAQVFVQDAGERIWLQGEMLRSGHARAYVLPGSADCMDDLAAAERQARESRAGLWAHAAYQVRPASRPWDLMRFRSTYQTVEGQVVSAADVRGQIYLNFGANWRDDFTATIRPAHKAAFAEHKLDLKALERRRVRVRGWIERRSGPMIELYHPSQIEVLPD
ncbi:MAG: thermonuclease family protein [Hyphomicrobiaceae bacterium]|nr:thermonuclease family protein [Hyphomicrobiaceae bacterium]